MCFYHVTFKFFSFIFFETVLPLCSPGWTELAILMRLTLSPEEIHLPLFTSVYHYALLSFTSLNFHQYCINIFFSFLHFSSNLILIEY